MCMARAMSTRRAHVRACNLVIESSQTTICSCCSWTEPRKSRTPASRDRRNQSFHPSRKPCRRAACWHAVIAHMPVIDYAMPTWFSVCALSRPSVAHQRHSEAADVSSADVASAPAATATAATSATSATSTAHEEHHGRLGLQHGPRAELAKVLARSHYHTQCNACVCMCARVRRMPRMQARLGSLQLLIHTGVQTNSVMVWSTGMCNLMCTCKHIGDSVLHDDSS